MLKKESPSDVGDVKGATLSTENQDISLGGNYLDFSKCLKKMVRHRVINL
jgi:hypothetical protein